MQSREHKFYICHRKPQGAIRLTKTETGEPVRQATSAAMNWDDSSLHVLFDCVDDEIRTTFESHDDPVFLQDAVEVFICSDDDLTHYFEIDVSPKNIVFDAKIRYDNANGTIVVDKSWDCEGLSTIAQVNPAGWTVHMAIPFTALGRTTPKPGEKWRINLYRVDQSAQGEEFQAWCPTLVTPANFHIPSRFGILVFEDSGFRG